MVYGCFSHLGFDGDVLLVNRRGSPAHGSTTYTQCREIESGIDLAILLVPNAGVPDALADAADAGAKGVITLGAGFAEAGEEGRAAQRELEALAADRDVAVLGPNAVGFLNLVDRVPAWVSPLPRRHRPGAVAIVSQSGNLGLTIADFAAEHGVGLSHVVTTGNEANVDVLDILDCLVEDERVRVLGAFVETIREPRLLFDVAARAAELGKPIVVLKTGASELGARIAQTHTGALVGDAAVVEAGLRAAGVVSVRSLEELVVTCGLLAHAGQLRPGGLGVVSISGGSNDIVADRAELLRVELPDLSEETYARLSPTVDQLGVATLQNPFDVTGAAIGNLELLVEPLAALGSDPSIALVAYTGIPFLASPPMVETYPYIGRGIDGATSPGVLMTNTLEPLSEEIERILQNSEIPFVLPGIELGLQAVGHAIRWSDWRRDGRAEVTEEELTADPPAPAGDEPVWNEAKALAFFGDSGLPVVPWRRASTGEEAVEAARLFGYPVVLKIDAAEVIHKTEVGGVALDLRSDEDVRSSVATLSERLARTVPPPFAFIVQPHRSRFVELIVGVERDPDWGLFLMVGLGGIAVEARSETALRRFPVDASIVRSMLDEIRVERLLARIEESPELALDRTATVIARFARLASVLEQRLDSMEINPLRVDGVEVEALDGVIVWRTEAPGEDG
jgi:acyl-CoA synthetase (NDP forming)